jgi:hypothetical protein
MGCCVPAVAHARIEQEEAMAQKVRLIALPVVGSAPVVIRCTQVTSRMEITEDSGLNAGVQQGLQGNFLTSNGQGGVTAGPLLTWIPNANDLQEPIVIAGYPGDHPPNTVPIGNGGSSPYPVSAGGPVTLGTRIIQLTSASATATQVRVVEWA